MNKIHKIIGSVALAAMLVSGLPDASAHAASAVTEAAQNKLKEITGNTYSFSKAEPFGNDVAFEIEGQSYSQVIVDAEGTVNFISAQFKYKDLQNAKFKKELKDAWKKAFPKNSQELDIVIVNYMNSEGLKVNTGNDADQLHKKDTKDREAIENKIKSYTLDQLLKTAAKQAKSIMNLDLSGYAAEKVKGNEDTVMFTKKGAPKVQGKFNSKGQFYYFEVM